MARYSSLREAIIYFVILMLLITGCSPLFADKPIERLKLADGEFDPCLLVTPTEFADVSGVEVVVSKLGPLLSGETPSPTANFIFGCVYRPDSESGAVFIISVITDATLKRSNASYSAAHFYKYIKSAYLEKQKETPSFKVNDIDSLGDKAYSYENPSNLGIRVLENEIYYDFNTRHVDDGGIGDEVLMELVKIALSRTP